MRSRRLETTNATTATDNDFSLKTSIETLTLADATNDFTLGTKAAAMGVLTVTGGTGVDTITTEAGFTNNLTIVGGGAADVINVSASSS